MVEPCLSKAGPTVKLTVVNTSETYQIFQSISCSWQDFWRTDDRNALLIGQSECAKNSLCTVVLAPGEKHAEQTSLLLFYGKPGRRKIRFGYSRRPSDFTSAELKRIHDSDEKFTYFSRTSLAPRFKPGKETFWSLPTAFEVTKQSIRH